jgi:biopolymer transport protein ExbD
MPDEQIIEVLASGAVNVNNNLFPAEAGQDMPALVEMLTRYRAASESANNKPMITIQAEGTTKHQRIIDVMNACAAAGIKHVSVGMGE